MDPYSKKALCIKDFPHFSSFWSRTKNKDCISSPRFLQTECFEKKKRDSLSTVSFVLALPIFPARLQASIFGVNELNFRVRNGNGWTLVTINTNSLSLNSLYNFPRFVKQNVVTRRRIELLFAAWEAAVLTAWPTGHMVHLQGLEPWTPWLRVRCSTSWAKGAYRVRNTPSKLNNDCEEEPSKEVKPSTY